VNLVGHQIQIEGSSEGTVQLQIQHRFSQILCWVLAGNPVDRSRMNANREWGEAVETNGFEEAPFGVGSTDFLNSILPSVIRVQWRPVALMRSYPRSGLSPSPKKSE
jgi:hypothetical protein